MDLVILQKKMEIMLYASYFSLFKSTGKAAGFYHMACFLEEMQRLKFVKILLSENGLKVSLVCPLTYSMGQVSLLVLL